MKNTFCTWIENVNCRKPVIQSMGRIQLKKSWNKLILYTLGTYILQKKHFIEHLVEHFFNEVP